MIEYVVYIIIIAMYISAYIILIKNQSKRSKKILKIGSYITGCDLILSIIMLNVFSTQMNFYVKQPVYSFWLGILFFIILFIPLYYIRFIKVTYYGMGLQDTIRKYILLVIIPLLIMLYFDSKFNCLYINHINYWILLLIIFNFLIIGEVWKKSNHFKLLVKMLGKKRYLKAFLITFIVQLIHVGIPEEYFFRVFLIGCLLPLGDVIAVVISSIIFGLGHIFFLRRNQNYLLSYSQSVLYHTSIGILFGVLWIKFSNFWIQVSLHAFFNSLILVYPLARNMFFPKLSKQEHKA